MFVFFFKQKTAYEMRISDWSSDVCSSDLIADVIEAFAKGGEEAYRNGFDGVALHAGHGYLIDQFFWNVTNLRTDRYGGSIAKRATFAAEIVSAIRRSEERRVGKG